MPQASEQRVQVVAERAVFLSNGVNRHVQFADTTADLIAYLNVQSGAVGQRLKCFTEKLKADLIQSVDGDQFVRIEGVCSAKEIRLHLQNLCGQVERGEACRIHWVGYGHRQQFRARLFERRQQPRII